MSAKRAMLCLAGEQVMPNAIAARQLEVKHLVVCHTADERKSLHPAERLLAWWSSQGGSGELRLLADPGDLARMRVELAAALSDDWSWVANVTGGTKLMSLATVSAAADQQAPVCYVDTPRQSLIWLREPVNVDPLGATFRLEEILRLHGQEILNQSQVTARQVQAARLLAGNRKLTEVLAEHCRNSTWRPGLTVDVTRKGLSQEQAKSLGHHGVVEDCQWCGTRAVLTMTEEGWHLCRGEWLEILAAEAFRLAGAGEVAVNVEVSYTHDPQQAKSETDALGVFGSTLVVAECKSGGNLKREEWAGLATRTETLGGSLAVGVMVWAPANRSQSYASQVDQYREQAADQGVLFHADHRPEDLAELLRQRLGTP